MHQPRLKSEIWVTAFIRRCWASDVPALLVRRGEATAGAVLIKANGRESGCVIYARGLLADGSWGWRRATGPDPVSEAEADRYVTRQIGYDSDLWVLEVESSAITQFVDDPVEC
ncbi:MAG: DUF1491 family protein [Alphaproteobacteria bacterium]|nr:MAG: DUF1491 family protein [Alphaproteobacteria bacterium]